MRREAPVELAPEGKSKACPLLSQSQHQVQSMGSLFKYRIDCYVYGIVRVCVYNAHEVMIHLLVTIDTHIANNLFSIIPKLNKLQTHSANLFGLNTLQISTNIALHHATILEYASAVLFLFLELCLFI